MPYDSEDRQDPYQTQPGYGQNAPDQGGQYEQQRQAAYESLRAAYKRYLKREPSEAELESHLAGRYDSATVQRALQTIQNSPEAAQTSPGQSTTPTPPGTQPPAPPGGQPAPFTREERDKLTWGTVGRMEGFEVGSTYGGDVKARNSVKNTFGRIASRYPATPAGLRQAMEDPEFKRAFPNARLIDHPKGDKIDFGGVRSDFESGTPVGVVDVGRAFSGPDQQEQTAWVWQPESTSSAAYQRTQSQFFPPPSSDLRYIRDPNDWRTGQEGPAYRAADAVVPPQTGEGLDAFDQYLKYLRDQMSQYTTQQPPLL